MNTAPENSSEEFEPGERGPKSFSAADRLRSFTYAFAGGRVLLASQHNAWIHAAATVLVLVFGLVLRVTRLEWGLLVLAMGLVWAMEAVNTAIELLADEFSLEYRPRLGRAKDVVAFGVLAAALAAVVVGLLVFVPRLVP